MPVPAVSDPKPQSHLDHQPSKPRSDPSDLIEYEQNVSRYDSSYSSPEVLAYQSSLSNPIQISPTREKTPVNPSLSIQSKQLGSPLALYPSRFSQGLKGYDMLGLGHENGSPVVSRSVSAGTRASPRLGSPFSTMSTPASFSSSSRQNRRSSVGGIGSFVGSYEESLLSGRMSSQPSKPLTFIAQVGVVGSLKSKNVKLPPHASMTFPAHFYNTPASTAPSTPYVGTIDLESSLTSERYRKFPGGYRVPSKGQVQIVIKNPNNTAVKLYLVQYDLTDMPIGTKTVLRQKQYYRAFTPGPSPADRTPPSSPLPHPRETLRYAIQLQFCCPARKKYYLYKAIKVVFSARVPDNAEQCRTVLEGPGEPKYSKWEGQVATMDSAMDAIMDTHVDMAGDSPPEPPQGLFANAFSPWSDSSNSTVRAGDSASNGDTSFLYPSPSGTCNAVRETSPTKETPSGYFAKSRPGSRPGSSEGGAVTAATTPGGTPLPPGMGMLSFGLRQMKLSPGEEV